MMVEKRCFMSGKSYTDESKIEAVGHVTALNPWYGSPLSHSFSWLRWGFFVNCLDSLPISVMECPNFKSGS
jgi:hypothetical protein